MLGEKYGNTGHSKRDKTVSGKVATIRIKDGHK
jgi:hypothetical protein